MPLENVALRRHARQSDTTGGRQSEDLAKGSDRASSALREDGPGPAPKGWLHTRTKTMPPRSFFSATSFARFVRTGSIGTRRERARALLRIRPSASSQAFGSG